MKWAAFILPFLTGVAYLALLISVMVYFTILHPTEGFVFNTCLLMVEFSLWATGMLLLIYARTRRPY